MQMRLLNDRSIEVIFAVNLTVSRDLLQLQLDMEACDRVIKLVFFFSGNPTGYGDVQSTACLA